MKSLLLGLMFIGIFGGLTLISYILQIGGIPFAKLRSQINMEKQIIKKTYNADNALYNYHWFKERFEAIGATETKIKTSISDVNQFKIDAGERKDWTFEDKTEYSRLNSIKTGITNHYEDLASEYNARAKEVDRAVFQDELPLFFNINPLFTGGAR